MASKLRMVFGGFSESAKPISSLMDDLDAEAPLLLKSEAVRLKHVAIRSASVVLLSGFLESFLRQAAEVFFKELSKRGIKYSELPELMRTKHFVAGLEHIQKVAKSDYRLDKQFSMTRLALGSLMDPPEKGGAMLYWEAFAMTKGNPGPDVLNEYLRGFGVQDPLVAAATAGNIDPGLLKISLESFIKLRNECAHTGTAKSTPQPSDIRDFVFLLRRLTLGISKVLDRRLVDLYQHAIAARI